MALSQKRSRFFVSWPSSQTHSDTSSQPEQTPTLPQTPKSSSATEQAAELLKTTNHIRTQLHEVQRLRDIKEAFLEPAERDWIDSIISDIGDAAHDVAVLLEPTRLQQETRKGKLSLGRQLRWKYRDSQRAVDKSNRLLACHRSLLGVLGHLQRLNFSESTPAMVYELDARIPSGGHFDVQELDSVVVKPSEKIAVPDMNEVKPVVSKHVEGKIVVSDVAKLDTTVGERLEERTEFSGVVNYEMDELLAWRRSRGAAGPIKRPMVHRARDSDASLR